MTRFTKDDLESDAFAQKLNMMLWSRCKAGKITQSEYMALVENRDVNLKRLIAEKNLTLDEAKQVRSLIMKYHLTMTVAINIAKDKITLSQARQGRLSKNGKTAAAKPVNKTKKDRSGRTKETSSDPAGAQKGKKVRPQLSQRKANLPKEKPQMAKQPVAKAPQKQRLSRDVPQPKRAEKTVPGQIKSVQKNPPQVKNQKNQKTNQQPQAEKRFQKPTHHNKSHEGHHDHERWEPKKEPQPYEVYYDDGIGAPASAGMRFYGSDRERSDRQWRDWRDERNAQIRSHQTSEALPPIPPGQDWYPGMGFRPADDPPVSYTPAAPAENKTVSREPAAPARPRPVSQEQTSNRPDFKKNRNELRRKNWHGDRRKAQMPRRDMEIRREVQAAEAQHQKQMKPEAGNTNPAAAVFRGNAHPSMGRHGFSHVRRFVPRKNAGKRPEGPTQ